MPRTLYDEEGKPVEVPADEELQAQTAKLSELEKQKVDIEEEKKKLDSDPALVNWRKVREQKAAWERKEKEYEEKLAAAGATVPRNTADLSLEELEKKQDEAMERKFMQRERNRLLKSYDEKTRKEVELVFEKLIKDEDVTSENIEQYMEQAERIIAPDTGLDARRRSFGAHGKPPVFDQKKEDFGDTESGKNLASQMGIQL